MTHKLSARASEAEVCKSLGSTATRDFLTDLVGIGEKHVQYILN